MKRLAPVLVSLLGIFGGALPVYAGHEFVPVEASVRRHETLRYACCG